VAARNTAVNKQQANELLDRARQYYEKAVEPDKQWFRDIYQCLPVSEIWLSFILTAER
jgi:hypothetical protein